MYYKKCFYQVIDHTAFSIKSFFTNCQQLKFFKLMICLIRYNILVILPDYFNYGFNEVTWSAYCERQRRMRVSEAGVGLHAGPPPRAPAPDLRRPPGLITF